MPKFIKKEARIIQTGRSRVNKTGGKFIDAIFYIAHQIYNQFLIHQIIFNFIE